MARLGRINKLTIKRISDYGAHLDGGDSGDIILPSRDLPDECQAGEELVVFVYKDGEDRLRATTSKPLVTVGHFAPLTVVETTPAGAFLDWGLHHDLFVPKSEQRQLMVKGKSYVVFAFLDEQNERIIASSKLDKFLDRHPPDYAEGEEVSLLIYEQTDLGFKAVVDQTHNGILYKNEVFRQLEIGQELTGYIKKVRVDQKLDLCLKQPGYQGVKDISQTILEMITAKGGRIAVTDKSPPEEIYAIFGVSKKTFKRAIGTLYQKRLITIDAEGIRLVR
jgi:predicted RNA-binding protein (virulence factor B family)